MDPAETSIPPVPTVIPTVPDEISILVPGSITRITPSGIVTPWIEYVAAASGRQTRSSVRDPETFSVAVLSDWGVS